MRFLIALKFVTTPICLTIVQVSVLTDQVEVQGEKIRDLDNCLEHHRGKLNATEELLQQVRLLQTYTALLLKFNRTQKCNFTKRMYCSTGAVEPVDAGDPKAGADD